jgi:hypothetical protein
MPGRPLPHPESKAGLTWAPPLHGLQASLDRRYIGIVNIKTGTTGTTDSHIPTRGHFDLRQPRLVNARYIFRVFLDNTFDVQPSIIGFWENSATIINHHASLQREIVAFIIFLRERLRILNQQTSLDLFFGGKIGV